MRNRKSILKSIPRTGLWAWAGATASMAMLYMAGKWTYAIQSDFSEEDDEKKGERGVDQDDENTSTTIDVQPDTISIAAISATGLFLLMGIATVAALIWFTMNSMQGGILSTRKSQVMPQAEADLWMRKYAGTKSAQAFPLLQIDPSRDLAEFRAREDGILRGYGWINRAEGKIRIPIDSAMRRLASRGISLRMSDDSAAVTGMLLDGGSR